MNRLLDVTVLPACLFVFSGCNNLGPSNDSHATVEIRSYAGVVVSESETFRGKTGPATLVTCTTPDGMECRMIFFVSPDMPVLVKGVVREGTKLDLSGTWKDPRGWDVSWKIHQEKDDITGEYKQPHDFGKILLKRIDKAP